jgi:hypothetical protein
MPGAGWTGAWSASTRPRAALTSTRPGPRGERPGFRKGSMPRQHRPDEGLGRSRGGLTCKIHLGRRRRTPTARTVDHPGPVGRRPTAALLDSLHPAVVGRAMTRPAAASHTREGLQSGAPAFGAIQQAVTAYLQAEQHARRIPGDSDAATIALALVGTTHHLLMTRSPGHPRTPQRPRSGCWPCSCPAECRYPRTPAPAAGPQFLLAAGVRVLRIVKHSVRGRRPAAADLHPRAGPACAVTSRRPRPVSRRRTVTSAAPTTSPAACGPPPPVGYGGEATSVGRLLRSATKPPMEPPPNQPGAPPRRSAETRPMVATTGRRSRGLAGSRPPPPIGGACCRCFRTSLSCTGRCRSLK